jgi:hypothetical protein
VKKKRLTQERLKELTTYDPETGIFVWKKVTTNRVKIGSKIGSVMANGYVSMAIDTRRYYAHRLAWLYTHGYFPENEVDHINRIRTDNRISNLREVSGSCNSRNACAPNGGATTVKGVAWYKRHKKWRARIRDINKSPFLGYYGSFDDAVCARLAAEQCLGWSGCESTSPAYLYVRNNIVKKYQERRSA